MITINTQEKWLEFNFNDTPLKSENNKVWLCLEVANKNQILIKMKFGKIVENTIKDENGKDILTKSFVSSNYIVQKELYKTNEDIENYNYEKLHQDALQILKDNCLTEKTIFTI